MPIWGQHDHRNLPNNEIFIDVNRTDIYTPNGTMEFPYKTINTALSAITPTNENRYLLQLAPGIYNEQITMKAFIQINGMSTDSVIIRSTVGDVILAGNAMSNYSSIIQNCSIICDCSDTSKLAIRVQANGSLVIDNILIYNNYANGIIVEGGLLISTRCGVLTVFDGIRVKNAAYLTLGLGNTIISGGGAYYDLIGEAGSDIQLDCTNFFINALISLSGTTTYINQSDMLGNNSSVSGDTVTDALNTIWDKVGTDLDLSSTEAIYFGVSTVDGTWRIIRDGNNLIFQRRESGNYITKSTISA